MSMNKAQQLWHRQARSDHAIFVHPRRAGVHECHPLHSLQMSTERLSKAYLWRSGHAPPKSHTGFVRCLRALLDRKAEQVGIASAPGFGRREALDHWVRSVLVLADSLQNIAPTEAGKGPNPEYPWPHEQPAHCPASHSFALRSQLTETGRGRKLLEFVEHAIARFALYA